MNMKQKPGEPGSKSGAAGCRRDHDDTVYTGCGAWANALRLWRTMPADGFGPDHRAAVAECMRRTSSTIEAWRAAIHGDAPTAIRLALGMERTSQITARTDLTMTMLLNCALNGSAGAALVLSHALRQMPLDGVVKHRLATSWLVSNLRLALPGLDRLDIARARTNGSIAPRSGTGEQS
jgi:hypothetical protein